ncbi:hypothetical protein, partial [Frankia sp. AgB32]|uniref:hypothetical protein n=1 Tax=Frankia sp. AgB32 TaxID=631119 RepID=UPI00200C31AD
RGGGRPAGAGAPGAGGRPPAARGPRHDGPPHPEPDDPAPGSQAAGELGLAAIITTTARVRADFDEVVATHRGHLAALGAAQEQLARLTAQAARIGAPHPAELTEAAAALAPLTAAAATDPLGIPPREPQRARAALDRAAATLDQLARAYDTLDGGLRDASAVLDAVLAAVDDGERSALQAAAKIRPASGELLRLPDGWLDDPGRGLRPWLERLCGLAAGPAPRRLAAARGLAAWRTVADETLTQARRVAEVNALPLRQRDELRGFLRALRQKAAATGLAEDPALERLYAGAHDVLYTAPTDLAAAREQVVAYAAGLNDAPRRTANDEGRSRTA